MSNEQDNNRRASTIEEIAVMLTDLRGCRKNVGITLRDVEEKTGISNAYLSQLETGKITNPSYKEVVLPLYRLYFNVEHQRVVLQEQDNKPEMTVIAAEIERFNSVKHYISVTEINKIEYAVSVLQSLLEPEKEALITQYEHGCHDGVNFAMNLSDPDEVREYAEKEFNETYTQQTK